MSIDAKVLCTETYDSLPSVVVTTDSRRILFDCGEGSQRLLGEHKVRFSKLDAVCLTKFSPDLFGGLPGLILTSADSGRGSIKLISPPSIVEYWKCTSYFMYRPNFNMLTYELCPSAARDSNLGEYSPDRIDVVRISDVENSTSVSSNSDSLTPSMLQQVHARDRVVCAGALEYSFSDMSLTCVPTAFNTIGSDAPEVRICYICSSPELPGKFDLAKALELGVPRGPMFGQLQSGRSVQLPDGRRIAPEQVLGTPQASLSVVIMPDVRVAGWREPCSCGRVKRLDSLITKEADICCSSCAFERNINRLVENQYLNRFQTGGARSGAVGCVFHFCSQEAINISPTYRALIAGFGSDCYHIVLGRENVGAGGSPPESAFMAATTYCSKLNQVCGAMFPKFSIAACNDEQTAINAPKSADVPIKGHLLLRYKLLPVRSRGLDTDMRATCLAKACSALSGYWDTVLRETRAGELLTAVNNYREWSEQRVSHWKRMVADPSLHSVSDCELSPSERVLVYHGNNELWFLGTASAIPSKYRNVSGIALHVKPAYMGVGTSNSGAIANDNMGSECGGIMLLDVGEGAWHQLLRIEMARCCECAGGVLGVSEDVVARQLLRRIRVVWVSHPHADHHLGLLSILALKVQAMVRVRARTQSGCEVTELDIADLTPIVVIAPPAILSFLEEYCACSAGSSVCVDGSYVPISTRQVDPTDDCTAIDSFWTHEIKRCQAAAASVVDIGAATESRSEGGFSSVDKNSCEGRTVDVNKEFTRYYYRRIQSIKGADLRDTLASVRDTIQTPGWLKDHQGVIGSAYHSPFTEHIEIANRTLAALGITKITNVRVDHCPQSYGIALELSGLYMEKQHEDENADVETYPGIMPFKLVYSGDTRPCADLVALGQGATLLVHEATFEDDMQEDAVAKSHCTVSEAIQAGVAMNAHQTILTHFSQRYATLPQLPDCAYVREGRVLPAFDFMTVRFADLLWSTRLTPVYYEVLSLEQEHDEAEDQEDGEKSTTKDRCKVKGKGADSKGKSKVSAAQRSVVTSWCNCLAHRVSTGTGTSNESVNSLATTSGGANLSADLCGICGVGAASGTKKRKVDSPN